MAFIIRPDIQTERLAGKKTKSEAHISSEERKGMLSVYQEMSQHTIKKEGLWSIICVIKFGSLKHTVVNVSLSSTRASIINPPHRKKENEILFL